MKEKEREKKKDGNENKNGHCLKKGLFIEVGPEKQVLGSLPRGSCHGWPPLATEWQKECQSSV